jgi:hypothetical protein
MFVIFMIFLGCCGGIFYILQGFKIAPMKIKENEAPETYVSRLNQRKISGVILILIGLLYMYQLIQEGI